ncbi:PREDICTED: protein cramped-like [Priapulus caudatus]|uniref:Protein cramped-like n=1 Tax=Priapulus caudatus TaxID=37621 RepID=A0ABM1F930_PRICU|nr:PREDICTED: protein cramped-like [Priapulus caudatus]
MVKRKRTVSIEEERAQECQNCCEEEATSMGKLVELAPVSVATMINAEGGNNPHSHDTRSKQVGSKLPIETSPPPVTLSIRSSGRTARRKRDSTPPSAPPAKKSTKTSSQPVPTGTPEVKARRSWELWTSDDKNTFFEALYEHGKDFDAIQNYIASKHKKRGGDPPVPPKDKDQVRGFYYREWHKISKHLDFGDDIKKQTQELYALINYGVLRRKVGGRLTEKNAQKLQDLINKGVTTVRMKVKGKNGAKNIRIKTPLCRALKKLNNIDEPKEEEPPRLPSGIVVTLRPHDNAAFSRVHALAQNPCARITVAAQKRLSALTTFLQNKWRSPYSKLRKQLGDSAPDNDKVIRLKPPRDLRMSALSVEPYEQHTTRDVTLTSYRRKVLRGKPEQDVCRDGSGRCDQEAVAVADAAEARTSRAQPGGESGKPGCDARATASDGGDVAVAAETSGERGAQPVAAETTSSCRREGESRPDAADGVRRSVVTETVYQRTLSEDAGGGQVDAVSSDEGDKGKEGLLAGVLPEPQRSYKSEVEEEKLRESSSESEEGQQEEEREKADVRAKRRRGRNAQQRQVLMSEERIRQGWTAADAGKLTIGELYLMLNSPEVIVLEYEWVSPDNAATASAKRLIQALEKLLLLAGTEFSVAKQKQLQQVGGNSASPCRCGALPLSQAATPPSSRTPGARSPATPRSSTPRAGAVRMQSPITPKSSPGVRRADGGAA